MNLHTHRERERERGSKVSVKYALIVVSLILISVYLVLGTGRFALFSGVPFFVNVAYLTLSALLFIHLKRLFWVFFVFGIGFPKKQSSSIRIKFSDMLNFVILHKLS